MEMGVFPLGDGAQTGGRTLGKRQCLPLGQSVCVLRDGAPSACRKLFQLLRQQEKTVVIQRRDMTAV